jgi:4-hydroxy-4-methyl-2-oxoglutarate aldolase
VTSLAERLAALDTCAVSDTLESLGRRGALSGIRPQWDCGRIAGPIRTVRLRRLDEGETAPAGPHLGARAIEAAEPGDVIVVAHGGRDDSAGWGGLLSAAAGVRGVRGCIVDGACRDVDDAVSLGFPLYARSATPTTARGRTTEEASDVPVLVDGLLLHPGDYVLADRSGVVVVPREVVAEVIIRAEAMAAEEREMLARLRAGTPVTQVLGRRYEEMIDAETSQRRSADAVS